MLTILNAIPTDVVEMVIVLSKNYELFQMLKKLLIKLNEPSRVSRLDDKFTEVLLVDRCIMSNLCGENHREYDKPCKVYDYGESIWRKYSENHRNNDLPYQCNEYGSRFWDKNNKIHRYNGNPVTIGCYGTHVWMVDGVCLRDDNLPVVIEYGGNRYFSHCKTKLVFDFLE